MFLPQAWNVEDKPSTGVKGFDVVGGLTIKESDSRYQQTTFIGSKSATKYSRSRAFDKIESFGTSNQGLVKSLVTSEPNAEFVYHRFMYQSNNAYEPFFECLIRTRNLKCGAPEVVFQKDLARQKLGFHRQRQASKSIVQSLKELHTKRSATESLARTLLNESDNIRSLVKNKLSNLYVIEKNELNDMIAQIKQELTHV